MDKHRHVSSIGFLALGSLAFAALTSQATNANAVTITVNGTCSLSQAISAVNTKKKVGGCAAGTGGDTIVLASNGTTTVSSSLTITRSVTIQSSVSKLKATITPAAGVFLPALLTVSPLAGTPASVALVDIYLLDSGTTTGIQASGSNSTDKLTLTRCAFYGFGNSGVWTDEVGVNISDSAFYSNVASLGGGLRVSGTGNNNVLTLSTSTFYNNEADSAGGALLDDSPGHSTINNCTFFQNNSLVGGALGLFGNGATFDINGSTIAYNSADLNGAGGSSTGSTALVNFTMTLIAENVIGTALSDWDFNSTINSLKDSLLGSIDSADGDGVHANIPIRSTVNSKTNVDASNGQVVNSEMYSEGGDIWDFQPGTLRLPPTSPAVDALASNSTGLASDERGYARGIDAPNEGQSGRTFDIGAYEFDPNAQIEDFAVTNITNGTLSVVSGVAGFQPSSGKGLKFIPGSSGASSVTLRLPLVNGGSSGLILHVQACPTCGKYQISYGDAGSTEPPPSFVTIGTQNYSAASTKNITEPVLPIVDASGQPDDFGEDDTIDIKFTLVSKPANSNGQMVIDFINES